MPNQDPPKKDKTPATSAASSGARVKPELMSPAGHWPQLTAAIEAGADAVYFGLNHFSARSKVGFSLEELPEVMRTLHGRGVKGFVTFNTLVFDHEIETAEETIIAISDSGADSIIVQDVGIAQLASEIAPDLAIHGSTQMSITSAQGAELARNFGCSRVVLGRELSLADIRRIATKTDVELEVFVHGALCVSYSGQCFSSEAWGGRSANRGKCAQACRLSYDLIVDGLEKDTGEYRYLLSPGDLYALEQIPELTDIGVHCLKIEGRYKDENYVALTTAAYRKAIDAAWENVSQENQAFAASAITSQEREDLEQVYSRGLGPWFMSGVNHQTVVRGRAPRHRGKRIGVVEGIGTNFVVVAKEAEINRGDGIVFDAADWRSPAEPEEGGNIYNVKPIRADNRNVRLEFGQGDIDFSRIREGDIVWRTHDPQLAKRARKFTRAGSPVHTRPVDFVVRAEPGQPLHVEATLESGITATYTSEEPLAPATNRPLDMELLQKNLARLGNTPFHPGNIELHSDNAVFVRTAELNNARRTLVESLTEKRRELPERRTTPANATSALESPAKSEAKQTTHLDILVRNSDQLDAAIECKPDSITLDYLELFGLRNSVNKIREAGLGVRVASPRILKPGEQNVIRFLTSLECDVLIRSGGLLHDFVRTTDVPASRLHGDFSLNVANVLSAKLMLDSGLSVITPTYDLNAQQIQELAAGISTRSIEVIAYSHLPVFHTEHCVFCRFLSDGTDNTNCGHPCEQHQLSIRDNQGKEHPVMADVGCRNTVFGADAQSDPNWLGRWQTAGIDRFRIEFVHQTRDQVQQISSAFRSFFAGELNALQLTIELQKNSPQGTTTGSLYIPPDFKKRDLKKLIQLS